VTWDSADDPANPKNWSIKRKWAATLIVSCFTLVSPISSSMISPALASISKDFNITNEVEAQLTLSIFVLAYAIGPLFLGPLSEIYGRVIVLQLSNLFYLAWNLGCGFGQISSLAVRMMLMLHARQAAEGTRYGMSFDWPVHSMFNGSSKKFQHHHHPDSSHLPTHNGCTKPIHRSPRDCPQELHHTAHCRPYILRTPQRFAPATTFQQIRCAQSPHPGT
jgi:hypothetical protein